MASKSPQRLNPRFVRIDGASQLTSINERLLGDKAWRLRYGVPHVYAGGVLLFPVTALERWLTKRASQRSAR